ncbi:hypothetical protein [Brevibacillus laterosporus]|uniref:hypothetical protein n=1 Tax=Brevibacillus laterosporus TaxID=1465 RepID=UPI000B9BB0FF|nr:hypothetical protein [Brevibacillus laterosporus]
MAHFQFVWDDPLVKTHSQIWQGNRYQITIDPYEDHSYLSLWENGQIVRWIDPSGPAFHYQTLHFLPFSSQVLAWGEQTVTKSVKRCLHCRKYHLLDSLAARKMHPYPPLCRSCRSASLATKSYSTNYYPYQ